MGYPRPDPARIGHSDGTSAFGEQAQEIRKLKQELQTLQAQNASMRSGMRRCVTCEYRIDYKNRQDHAVGNQ